MSRDEHARSRAQIDQHFAAGLRRSAEAEFRVHLTECGSCRAYYERHLVLAALDPGAPTRAQRLGRPLGLGRPRRSWIGALSLAVPVAAALLLFVTVSGRPPLGYVARGGGEPVEAELRVYRVGDHEHTASTIHRGDELAFAYRNPAGRGRLLVFGIDEHRHVHWYHPAWTDPATSPGAIAIAPGLGTRELPEAIVQPLDGTRLTIYGLFTDRALDVRQIEAAWQHGEPALDQVTLSKTELVVLP